jgi:hypothetical protein
LVAGICRLLVLNVHQLRVQVGLGFRQVARLREQRNNVATQNPHAQAQQHFFQCFFSHQLPTSFFEGNSRYNGSFFPDQGCLPFFICFVIATSLAVYLLIVLSRPIAGAIFTSV